MQNNCSNSSVVYGGFFARLAAYLIDSIVVGGLLLIVRLWASGLVSAILGGTVTKGLIFQYTWLDILLYALYVFYFVILTYTSGRTLGKYLMNLKVVGAQGKSLTLWDVIYRESVGKFLSKITMHIGYLMIGVDKEKRGLHDMLCDTRVIYEKKVRLAVQPQPPYTPPARQVPPQQAPARPVPPQQVPPEQVPHQQIPPQQQMPGGQVPPQPPVQ